MKVMNLLPADKVDWRLGWQLAGLNAVVAGFSGVSFLLVLYGLSAVNHWRLAADGGARPWPFPYPILFLLYGVMFMGAWWWFGRRLTVTGRDRVAVVLVGISPLLALSLLGYVSALGLVVAYQFGWTVMPIAAVFVWGGLATLILLTGVMCGGVVFYGR
ncbi:MAG TPA: hypothetical protein VLL52_08505 [Anaerolineae bacterium]|nr:hypothetical protein [Anaerolineae bacterium]